MDVEDDYMDDDDDIMDDVMVCWWIQRDVSIYCDIVCYLPAWSVFVHNSRHVYVYR